MQFHCFVMSVAIPQEDIWWPWVHVHQRRRCFFHTFSAFWLRSSVVSVLISVKTDNRSIVFGHFHINIWYRRNLLCLRKTLFGCSWDCTFPLRRPPPCGVFLTQWKTTLPWNCSHNITWYQKLDADQGNTISAHSFLFPQERFVASDDYIRQAGQKYQYRWNNFISN